MVGTERLLIVRGQRLDEGGARRPDGGVAQVHDEVGIVFARRDDRDQRFFIGLCLSDWLTSYSGSEFVQVVGGDLALAALDLADRSSACSVEGLTLAYFDLPTSMTTPSHSASYTRFRGSISARYSRNAPYLGTFTPSALATV